MSHNRKISVIGLGYVGLPVAVAFAKKNGPVIGFDINPSRIDELLSGFDRTNEVSRDDLANADLTLTTAVTDLKKADFHIVTVPTPIDDDRNPDFSALVSASKTVGSALKRGDIVVYESTVYPGVTEDICVPILEHVSGLIFDTDFTVGYSPERINPGDTAHRFETIAKVVSGSTPKTLEIVSDVYGSVITAQIHQTPDIKTAEAAKVIENTQRDLNIALMNELSMMFHKLEIDTHDVLAAANTKWNFLPFTPGLVGGHCIGVDPYYLTHRAKQVGYEPNIILAGRETNDSMARFVADEVIRLLKTDGGGPGEHIVSILGITFKEDVPDVRNTKVVDLIARLKTCGCAIQIHDPVADAKTVNEEFGLDIMEPGTLQPADCIVLAVSHAAFREAGWPWVQGLLKNGQGLVADIKGILSRESIPEGIDLWRV